MVAKWKGLSKPIVFDWKTASKEYDQDAVLFSPQLTTYVHSLSDQYENTRQAGFLVLNKRLNKKKIKTCKKCAFDGTGMRHATCSNETEGIRCHGEWSEKLIFSANTQVLINDIPEQTENIVLENYENINKMIKNGIFSRNFTSCKKQYGTMTVVCPYWDLCYHGKKTGLIEIEK